MDHQLPEIQVPTNQVDNSITCSSNEIRTRNNNVDQSLSDKLTPLLLKSGEDFDPFESQNESLPQLSDVLNEGFCRQQYFSQRDMELLDDNEENETREQMEIQIREEAGDYGDIQFFHHKLMLQQHLGHNEFGIGSGVSSFGTPNPDTFNIEECDDNGNNSNNFSENPFVFPDNVMEYGEPQFFPGNCVGYLETILEEADEEFEEDEESSGRYWWTGSDTDTDSVVRVDDDQHRQQLCNNNKQSQSSVQSAPGVTNLFRSSSSRTPFEFEDLHLLDQLDLAFEETLMEPRRRSGIAAFGGGHFLDQPLHKQSKLDDVVCGAPLQRSASHDGERTTFSCEDFIVPLKNEKLIFGNDKAENNGNKLALGNSESKETFGSSLSPSSSDSGPHEVAEEDFFYSSPGSDESEEGSSSDDSGKNGTVLAEFSLSQNGNGGLASSNSFNSGMLFGSARNRRSLESPSTASSRLKSFRSFDSLNSLSGTELLFSKADTFPSFHYIKEDVEPSSKNEGQDTNCTQVEPTGGEDESQSLPSHNVSGFPPTFNKITKKTSHSSSTSTASSSCNSGGMMSSENLSEDSGIGPEGLASHATLAEKRSSDSFSDEVDHQQQQDGESAKEFIVKSEFALNPLVFSSLSSSSDAGSNSPSINSVPSLNNNESQTTDCSDSELKESERCFSTAEKLIEKEGASSQDDIRVINHNSLSNFHQSKVDESDSSQIERTSLLLPQAHNQRNHKAEPIGNESTTTTISSNIPFESKLPISTNDPSIPPPFALSSSTNSSIKHCSSLEEFGLHPYSDHPDQRISATRVNTNPVSSHKDSLPDNLNTNLTTTAKIGSQVDTNSISNVHLNPFSQSSPLSYNVDSSTLNYNDNANTSLTSIKTQEWSKQGVGVHCQVPSCYLKEMEIGKDEPKNENSSSLLPPPPHCQQSDQVVKKESHISDKVIKPRSCVIRERSNSESEFECVESALELDSIALAYSIVNSPTKAPSSHTITTNNVVDEHVNKLNGESGPVSTLTRSGDGMQKKHEQKMPRALAPSSCVSPGQLSGNVNGSSVGNNSIETTWPAVATESGIKSAKISLHHEDDVDTENESGLVQEGNREYTSNANRGITFISSSPQKEAVGQDHHNGTKPSRSVNSDNSSCVDVVQQHAHHHKGTPINNKVNKSEGRVDKDKHSEREEEEKDILIIARPIDPVHIGVAEVKKFTQLDSSISRKPNTHHQGLGESDSDTNLASSSATRATAISECSNFGFFGRSSHITASPRFTRPSEATKSVLASSPLTFTNTESSESTAYGFPSHSFTSHPIPGTQFHSEEGGAEIPSEPTNNRAKDRGGYLHQKFTIPLAVYSATVLSVAPSIPSQRLTFLNEKDPVRIEAPQEESSSSSLKVQTKCITEPEVSKKRHAANPPHQVVAGVISTNTSFSSFPDILVVKQGASSPGSEVIHTGFSGAMEVDIANAPIGGVRDRQSTSPSRGVPIKTTPYGVEVVLISSRTPSPAPVPGGTFPFSSSLKQPHPSTSSSLGEDVNNPQQNTFSTSSEENCPDPPAKVPRTRVHFSPVVSEISWRESYIDQGSEFSGSTEDIEAPGYKIGANNTGQSPGEIGANGDSLVRPLQFCGDSQEMEMSNQIRAQTPPVNNRPEKGPILVEKVQMRSSFLQGGEDEEEDLERKLTMDVHISDPSGEGHLLEDDPRKEGVQFRSGAGHNNYEHNLDLYEDVNVNIQPLNNTNSSTTLSMVPDLLSQCENVSNGQTHIDVCIEQVGSQNNYKPPLKPKPLRKSHSPTPKQQINSSEIPPPPLMMDVDQAPPQQQIFPKMFAEDVNGSTFGKLGSSKSDSKNNSSSSLNKGKKSKSFGLGGSAGSKKSSGSGGITNERDNKDKETDALKENKTKPIKTGFFERLSKIRLSGSKPKKQKVHPKMDELEQGKGVQPLKTHNTVNLNGNSGNGKTKLPSHPILKNSGNPTPVIPNYTPTDFDNEHRPDEANQAFENILEEIAGIKSIKMRIDKSSSQNGTPTERPTSTPPQKEMRSFAKRKQFYSATESSSPSPPISPNSRSVSDLDTKLSQFRDETSKTRAELISKSHPDLDLIEDMVRQQSMSPEPVKSPSNTEETSSKQGKSPESKKSPKKSPTSETGQKNEREREWYKLLKSAAEKYYYRGNKDKDDNKRDKPVSFGTKTGIVETDLDTGASREMLDAELVELDKKVPFYAVSTSEIPSATSSAPITTMAMSPGSASKARSLTNLSTRLPLSIAPSKYDDVDHLGQGELNEYDERAKSYEFLLDDNQKSCSVPPENKLRTETRQLSEHELRIQRSLQRLNVPDWFKNHEATSRTSTPDRPSSGHGTDKTKILTRRTEYGSAGGLAGGWAGLSAFKAPSMSSLQSSNGGRYSGSLNRSNFIRGRPATMSATRLSRESLSGTGSASHSPSAYDRCSFTYGMPYSMTRFGQGRMSNNSGTVTPTSTADSTVSTNLSVKKPYLGWRSQERLNALAGKSGNDGAPKLSVYLPPEERLAADLLRTKVTIRPPLSDRPPLPKPPPRSEKTTLSKTSSIQNQDNSIPLPKTPDIHDSIREVTRAINKYVEHEERGAPKPQSRKKSPARKAIWMESSFVGQKPANK